MYATLKIQTQDQEIRLEINLSHRAGRIYREHFDRDILNDMTDLYNKLNCLPLDGIDMQGIDIEGKTDQEITDQLISRVDPSKLTAVQMLSFEETERAGQIVWAFAKNKDKDIPDYEKWIDKFDFILPVGDMITVLFDAWRKPMQMNIYK